jgi:hypothetical protein
VAEVLGVSRSQLYERLRGGLKGRGGYRKGDDAALLEPVRRLVDERPTYGYRRIGALLNRERLQAGLLERRGGNRKHLRAKKFRAGPVFVAERWRLSNEHSLAIHLSKKRVGRTGASRLTVCR